MRQSVAVGPFGFVEGVVGLDWEVIAFLALAKLGEQAKAILALQYLISVVKRAFSFRCGQVSRSACMAQPTRLGLDATLDVPVFALEIRAGCSDGRTS